MELKDIGKRFQKMRHSLGFSQIELSNALSEYDPEKYQRSDQRKISRIERGEQSINGKLLLQLREQFDINTEWLMSGIGTMVPETKPTVSSSSRDDAAEIDRLKRENLMLKDTIEAQKTALEIARTALQSLKQITG